LLEIISAVSDKIVGHIFRLGWARVSRSLFCNMAYLFHGAPWAQSQYQAGHLLKATFKLSRNQSKACLAAVILDLLGNVAFGQAQQDVILVLSRRIG
jgi:hypothetical protein